MKHEGVQARLMGDRAVLLECADVKRYSAATAGAAVGTVREVALLVARLPGVTEVVPAARTVLAICADWRAMQGVLEWAQAHDSQPGARHAVNDAGSEAAHVRIDVFYDGEDLARAAALAGVSSEALAAAHTNAHWRAVFGGFAPGFMYLTAADWPYRLPRLDAPRARVEAGAVGLAGEFSAVYPAASPGGWQLIGRTAAPMWQIDRPQPALVRPGDTVEFRAVRELVRASSSGGAASVHGGASDGVTDGAAIFTVLRPGVLTLVQDAGRPGYRAVGVTESGAMDRGALGRANAAVGNPPGAAALEVLVGGLELRVQRPATVAIAGSAVSLEVHEAGERRTVLACTPVAVQPGQRLTLGHIGPGMRDYLAVRGGVFAVATPADGEQAGSPEEREREQERGWLGSRATDTLSGIGPAPLTAGTQIGVGSEEALPEPAATAEQSKEPARSAIPVLRVLAGPRDDWFEPAAFRALTETIWSVSPQSNRVGARLNGPALERRASLTDQAAPVELPSEGMVRGAIQVPPGGEPVLFLADHPVTGGYPVIAVVIDEDLNLAGQLAPGDPVRFALVNGADASEEGTWPPAGAATPRPAWVNCTFELDGRRHPVKLSGALAAAIDRAFVGDVANTAAANTPDTEYLEAAHEFIAGIVRAIRSSA